MFRSVFLVVGLAPAFGYAASLVPEFHQRDLIGGPVTNCEELTDAPACVSKFVWDPILQVCRCLSQLPLLAYAVPSNEVIDGPLALQSPHRHYFSDCYPDQSKAQMKILKIGILADSAFYKQLGSDELRIKRVVYEAIDYANLLFVEQFSIRIRIDRLYIVGSESPIPGKMAWMESEPDSSGKCALDNFDDRISAFQSWVKQRDELALWHLFTACYDYPVVGEAYNSCICRNWCAGFSSWSSYEASVKIFIHELGHNFGAPHLEEISITEDVGPFTMWSGQEDSIKSKNMQFHSHLHDPVCEQIKNSMKDNALNCWADEKDEKGGRCGCKQELLGNGVCDWDCNVETCGFDRGDCKCSPECPTLSLGNQRCDSECFSEQCNYDDGDCSVHPPKGTHCWPQCKMSGFCSFCGIGNKCCRKNWNGGEKGCSADEGSDNYHGCVIVSGNATNVPETTTTSSTTTTTSSAGTTKTIAACATTNGKQCMFPFEYYGTHLGCTNLEDDNPDMLWCATGPVNSTDGSIPSWGYCSDDCPLSSYLKPAKTTEAPATTTTSSTTTTTSSTSTTKTIAACATTDGKQCMFPFEFDGTHLGCTNLADDNPDMLWCATGPVNSTDGSVPLWGYCNDDCPLSSYLNPAKTAEVPARTTTSSTTTTTSSTSTVKTIAARTAEVPATITASSTTTTTSSTSTTKTMTACATTDGKQCMFPFEFDGTHLGCTNLGDDNPDMLWCPTGPVNSTDGSVPSWGYCSDDCQLSSYLKPDTVFFRI